MTYLLDTHTWLWFATENQQLSERAQDAISNANHVIYVSPASYWEIAIKISLGKYKLSMPYDQFMSRAIDGNAFRILPIEPRHTAALIQLPFHHRDPFDRLLIAQSWVDLIPVISADKQFDPYSVQRLW